ncbi:hypothetical protein MMA231_02534 [Asticcacaulis sp. MM231]
MPAEINLASGDAAHFAVRLKDGSILNGTAMDLARLLRQVNLRKLGTPFFNVDAYTFIGDAMKRTKAVEAAASLFKNRNVRRSWKRRELSSPLLGLQRSRTGRTTGASETEQIQRLRSTFHDRMWSVYWSNTWNSTRDEYLRRTLEDIASEWLADFWGRHKPELVLVPLLFNSHSYARFFDLSLSALSGRRYSSNWVQIWSLLGKATRKRFLKAAPALAKLGTEFLRDAIIAKTKGVRISSWAQVFRGMVNEVGLTSELAHLGLQQMGAHHNDFGFQKNVLNLIFWDPQSSDIWNGDRERFLELADISNFWITVFNATAQPSAFVVSKSIEYLKNGNPMLSNWPSLWRACGVYLGSKEHQQIAKAWLLKNTSQMKSWPEVVLEIEADYITDPQVHEVIANWIDNHQTHSLYNDVVGQHLTWRNSLGRLGLETAFEDAEKIFQGEQATAMRSRLIAEAAVLVNDFNRTTLTPQIISTLIQIQIALRQIDQLGQLTDQAMMFSLLLGSTSPSLTNELKGKSQAFLATVLTYTSQFPQTLYSATGGQHQQSGRVSY